jgi:hypothetical protein
MKAFPVQNHAGNYHFFRQYKQLTIADCAVLCGGYSYQIDDQ